MTPGLHNVYFAAPCDLAECQVGRWPLGASDIARFWALVSRGTPDACWPWIGSRAARGRYGKFVVYVRGCKRHLVASRVAFALVNGPIPSGVEVCHSCDNSPCCNPAHLFAGTHTDNMRDASAKGRLSVVDRRNRAVQPLVVADYLESRMAKRSLAAKYHVSHSTVKRWIRKAA